MKNKGGRPQKYTPESLKKKALEYFDFLNKKENWIDKGIGGKFPRPKTLSGLCIFLGVSKDYISEKAKDEEFSETIKRIRLVVENNIEEGILLNIYNPTSGIFNLKNNFAWKDRTEIENTGEGEEAKKNFYGKLKDKIDEMDDDDINDLIREVIK